MARPTFGPKEMHVYKCMRCGNSYSLPFGPSSKRPNYCNRCFGEVDTLEGKLNKLMNMQKKRPGDLKISKEIEKIKALIERR